MKTEDNALVAPRSWLFVPGDRPERFDKAVSSGCDAVILDLEDAVAAASRPQATDNVIRWLGEREPDTGPQLWVRVPSPDEITDDLRTLAALPALNGLVLPKVESAGQVTPWPVPVMAQIETAIGVLKAADIAANGGDHLVALALGTEDLALSLQCLPDAAGMTGSAQQMVLAARAYGKFAYACPGSIAVFRDLDAWEAILLAGRGLGSDGALCIHPAQIDKVNQMFSPDAQEVEQARRVVAAFEASLAAGQAAVQLDGRMLDAPVVERARRLVQRAHWFAA
ncbi:MAG: CoA ester lyase [Burkholderiaceae bacterium]